MEAIYDKRGSAKFGSSFWFAVNGSWPFGRLIINREELIVSIMGIFKTKVKLRDIDLVKSYFFGVKIEHHSISSKFIVFYPNFSSKEDLFLVFENLGIKVER